MKLDVLHVDQLRARMVGQRVTVARAIPAVARDLVSLPDPTGREDDGFRAKNPKPPTLAVVAECSADSAAILQQGENTNLHVNINAAVDPVILQGANHFQTCPIADVREARVFMASEISLQNATILCPIEDCAPSLKFAHPRGRV